MLTYDKFKEKTVNEFMDHLSDEYRHYKLRVNSVFKVNAKLDALSIFLPDQDVQISPTVYIDNMYKEYMRTGDADRAIQNGADIIMSAMPMASEFLPSAEKCSNAEDKIIFQLINTDQNTSLLNDVPHREFLDMSLIYRWVFRVSGNSIYSSVIHNDIAEAKGLSEEDLFKLAYENTRVVMRPKITSFEDLLYDFMIRHEVAEDDMERVRDMDMINGRIQMVTNKSGYMGATAMVYPDILADLAKKIGSDYYILPASIHELIAVPAMKDGEETELAEMVESINMTEIDPVEVLSNNIYFYSIKDERLRVISPMKAN